MAGTKEKSCIIALNMGGPDSIANIKEYLYNIFTDRAIIRLPGGALLQKPFARMISTFRSRKVMEHYKLIGGSSPLLKWTKIQIELLEKLLRNQDHDDIKCYVGMRYFHPFIKEAIESAYADGFRRLVFLPLYPQFSTATTGSSFTEVNKICEKYEDIESIFINDFHDHSGYIDLLKSYIDNNINSDQILLFSAHSLPKKFVDEGDPYVDQIKKTAELTAGEREYFVSFQSRTGPVDWVGPDTVETVKKLLNERSEELFIVPVSFTSDHIETLYEIDIELKEFVGEEMGSRIHRMPMFNDDPRFAEVLKDVVCREAF